MPGYTLRYFDAPGRGEPIRLLLLLGKFDWVDATVSMEEWAALKPSTKWGQLPLLTTPEGREMAQTQAVVRFLGKQVSLDGSKLYPEDPLAAFEVDEMIDAFEDVRGKLGPTMGIQDKAQKEAARAKLFEADGACTQLLCKIEAFSGENFLVGGRLSVADLWAHFYLNFLRTPFWEGVPKDFLDKYPKLRSVLASVASVPEIREHYQRKDATASPLYAVFK